MPATYCVDPTWTKSTQSIATFVHPDDEPGVWHAPSASSAGAMATIAILRITLANADRGRA